MALARSDADSFIYDSIPLIQKEEWRAIYEIAQKQSLLGIVYDGILKMGAIVQKRDEQMEMDVNLLMAWTGKCRQIEMRNNLLNKAVVKASTWFQKRGFRTCTLKGQGNALMYPHPAHRTPGDIDLWVLGKPSEVIRFVHSIAPLEKASYHHIDFPAINGIQVEVHYRPCYLHNPLHNHRLQRFFIAEAEKQFGNVVTTEEGTFTMPTASFNVVYQLVHIYNHLFQEGIGLRQIMDYYLVVESLIQTSRKNTHYDAITHSLKCMGLWHFCGAVMYVLHVVLGLPEDRAIVPMDVQRGRMLLEEILQGGNFGQFYTRGRSGNGTMRHNIQRFKRDLRLMRYYPEEALAEPFFRLWHFFWRITNRKRFRDA